MADEKNPAAVSLGSLGGSKGGVARAAKLTPAERKLIAQGAAQARWATRNLGVFTKSLVAQMPDMTALSKSLAAQMPDMTAAEQEPGGADAGHDGAEQEPGGADARHDGAEQEPGGADARHDGAEQEPGGADARHDGAEQEPSGADAGVDPYLDDEQSGLSYGWCSGRKSDNGTGYYSWW